MRNSGIFTSPVARATPFDPTSTAFLATNVDEALKELRSRNVSSVTITATTLNGTLSLLNSSNSSNILTGTQTGFSVNLPDATTCTVGHRFEIWNLSSQVISIKDFGSNVLTTLKANARTEVILQVNSTSNGTWVATYTLDNGNVFGTTLYYTSADPETSTSSTTVWLNKITLSTPSLPAGDYLVQYQFVWRAANANRSLDVRVQRGGVNIDAWTPFTANVADRQLLSGFQRVTGISGSQTFKLDFKVSGTATTVYMFNARMFVWRIA